MVILSIWVLIYTYPGNHEYCFYVGPCKRQKYMIVLMRKVDITNIDVIVCTKKIVPQGKYLCFFTQPEITRQINLELTNIDYYRIKYEITRIYHVDYNTAIGRNVLNEYDKEEFSSV